MKSAFVALVGRPSSGKSTLLNRLCRAKVAITSTVPQTTRNKIRGVVNRAAGQLVFIDTPGYHDSERKFNTHLRELVLSSVKEADVVLYLVDLSRPPGREERSLMRLLAPCRDRVVVALNKADRASGHQEALRAALEEELPGIDPVVISALEGSGTEELVERILAAAPEGDMLYPEDIYTDQEPEFRIAEVIREKAIHQTRAEVPHALFVEIADMEMSEGKLWVRAFLCVERESQKGIVVGKGGARIKAIRTEAEQELRGLFPYSVGLDLRVKVRKKWKTRDALIRKLIH